MLDINVGEVIRYSEEKTMGVVKEIRIISTAKFVKKFSGDADKVMVRIHAPMGTALIWPKQQEIIKVSAHEAKEFNSKFKLN